MLTQNVVNLEGYLEGPARDVGRRTPVAILPVRVEETIRGGERVGEVQTHVVPVRVFGAEAVACLGWRALAPGVPVRVRGRLSVSVYTPQGAAEARSTLEVHALSIAVLAFPQRQAPAPERAQAPAAAPQTALTSRGHVELPPERTRAEEPSSDGGSDDKAPDSIPF